MTASEEGIGTLLKIAFPASRAPWRAFCQAADVWRFVSDYPRQRSDGIVHTLAMIDSYSQSLETAGEEAGPRVAQILSIVTPAGETRPMVSQTDMID